MKGKNVVNIKKSKFALLGKLAAITVLGTVLPVALPCFNMDSISKVRAVKDEEKIKLSQNWVAALCKVPKYCFEINGKKMLDIPDGINLIEPGAFCDLPDDLTAVFLPNSVTKLDANVFEGMTQQEDQHIIFAVSSECECSGNFPKNIVVSKFDRSEKQPPEEFGIDGELDDAAVEILSLIPKYAPNGANGLLEIPPCFNSIEHGATVTEICTTPVGLSGKDVSRSSVNKTVEFPEGTVTIENGTLEKMCPAKVKNGEVENDKVLKTDVERVVIPSSCINIKPHVFENCTNLKEIVFKGDDVILPPGPVPFVHSMDQCPGPIHRVIKGNALGNCTAETIVFPDSMEIIPDYACCGNERVKTVVLPRNCERIGRYSFANCPNLKKIIFSGDKLTSIGDAAFLNNYSLKQVEIPESCMVIGNASFQNCNSLKKVEILGTDDGSSKLLFVGNQAFGNCCHLTEDNRPTFPKHITCGDDVFIGSCGCPQPRFEGVSPRNCFMFNFPDPFFNFPPPPPHF